MILGMAITFKIQPKTEPSKNNQLHFIKTKILLCKDKIKRMLRQATDCEEILAKDTLAKGLLSKINNKTSTIKKLSS